MKNQQHTVNSILWTSITLIDPSFNTSQTWRPKSLLKSLYYFSIIAIRVENFGRRLNVFCLLTNMNSNAKFIFHPKKNDSVLSNNVQLESGRLRNLLYADGLTRECWLNYFLLPFCAQSQNFALDLIFVHKEQRRKPSSSLFKI